jgi:predicted enzyme related to lactoylglutathione lyase
MIFVKDQNEALAFWVGKLNFTVLKDIVLDPKLRWIQITPPDSKDTSLILYPKFMVTNRMSRPLPVIIFETFDIQSTIEQMKKNGVVFSHYPMHSEIGTYVLFKDNEGNDFIMMEQSIDINKR